MRHDTVAAGTLHVGHIGYTIRFLRHLESIDVTEVVTGELRQISHNGAETHLHYGDQASREVTLSHSHPVSINPPDNYGDYMRLTIPIESEGLYD